MSHLASQAAHVLPAPAAQFRFGRFRLCLVRRSLWRGQKEVALTPRALDILAALVRSAGRVMTREELRQAVWGETVVQDSNLTVNLCLVRRALAPDDYIVTVPGRGYQFTAPVVTELGPAADGAEVLWLTCLPFRCLGAEGKGLAEDVSVAAVVGLAQLAGLQLRPAGAAPQCGRDWTLEGCVQAHGAQVLVTAELVRPNGSVAWAEQRSFEDLDAPRLHDHIAVWLREKIAEKLQGGWLAPAALTG
jgi:DNA-binding winged helix-turn-helix (wHTH) protein